MREIITLQLGSLSNYTAAHFWNAQESYFTYGDQQGSAVDHNVHWRAGIGRDGAETFLPRTVVYDVKAAFGALRSVNPLYEAPAPELPSNAAADSLWPGPSTAHEQEPVPPSAYQQSLDAGSSPPKLTTSAVRYWSDYLRVYFHPKSLVQLYDAELNSAAGNPPERFALGADLLFGSLGSGHDIVDAHWRPFVEECDLLQGMQVLTTLDDAWGGFASSYLEALRDEHPKSCIWVWGLQTPPELAHASSAEKRRLRLANTAQSLSQACSQASIVVPLAVPDGRPPAKGLAMDPGSPWHVSALLSTAVESAALPSRLAAVSGHRPITLSDLAETLNVRGNQTLASSKLDVGIRAADLDRETPDIDLFHPGPKGNARPPARPGHLFGQLSTYRGSGANEGDRDASPEPVMTRPVAGNPVVRRFASRLAFPLLDSYPSIYIDTPANQAGVPVRALLSTDSSMAARIGLLRSQVSRSVAPQERENLANGLMEIADAYRDDWSSGSDGDGDDDL